jgi:fumarate reductase flavoprotein subunit
MESGCGVYREQASMDDTARTVAQLKGRFADVALEDTSKVFNTEIIAALELGNMLDVAESVAVSAAHRQESRGAHTRKDHTTRDDQNYLYHTLCSFDPAGPRLSKKDVALGKWVPEERKY